MMQGAKKVTGLLTDAQRPLAHVTVTELSDVAQLAKPQPVTVNDHWAVGRCSAGNSSPVSL